MPATRPRAAVRVAWLSLDAGDADLRRFLTHLVAAIQPPSHARSRGRGAAPCSSTPTAGPRSRTSWSAWSTTSTPLAGPTVLALDDYHVIDAPPVHEAVTFLLDNLPPQVTLAMTTRADPPLPLSAAARARRARRAARRRPAVHRPDEADAFLNDVMGLELEPQPRRRARGAHRGLGRRAPAGRALGRRPAAGDADGGDDVERFVEAFTGSHRFVLDYLVEEVLDSQPDEVRAFLLDTSRARPADRPPLRRAHRPHRRAADARDPRAGEPVRRPARRRAPVVPLPPPLRRRAARPPRAPRTPTGSPAAPAAAGWYAEHGLLPTPSAHALAGGDAEHAADLVELALPDLRRQRARTAPCATGCDALPEDVVRRRRSSPLHVAWTRLSEGDLDGVEAVARRGGGAVPAPSRASEACPRRGPADGMPAAVAEAARARDEELRALPAMIAVYRASVAQARGDVAGTVAARPPGTRAGRPGGPLPARCRRRVPRPGGLGRRRPRAPRSTRSPRRSPACTRRATSPTSSARPSSWPACGWRAAAPTRRAGSTSARWPRPRPARPGCSSTTGDLHVGLADVLREQGELDAAAEHLEIARGARRPRRRCWRTGTAGTPPWPACCGRAATSTAPSRCSTRPSRCTCPATSPTCAPIPRQRARVRIAQGRLADAREWAREHGVSADGRADLPGRVRPAHPRPAAGRRAPGGRRAAARSVIGAARPGPRRGARRPTAAAASSRPAWCGPSPTSARGDVDAALADLGPRPRRTACRPATAGCSSTREPPMDGAAPARPPRRRRRLPRQPRTHAGARCARAPAEPAQPSAAPSRGDRRHAGGTEPHRASGSSRCSGCWRPTSPARRSRDSLFVSVNTLRTHTKHIFTKLDVNTRRAAVRRASELGLLVSVAGRPHRRNHHRESHHMVMWRSPRRLLASCSSPDTRPAPDEPGARHDHHRHRPHQGRRRRRRRRRRHLHRRPDQPPARRLLHHRDHRVGGPQLRQGRHGRPRARRHHRHVPAPATASAGLLGLVGYLVFAVGYLAHVRHRGHRRRRPARPGRHRARASSTTSSPPPSAERPSGDIGGMQTLFNLDRRRLPRSAACSSASPCSAPASWPAGPPSLLAVSTVGHRRARRAAGVVQPAVRRARRHRAHRPRRLAVARPRDRRHASVAAVPADAGQAAVRLSRRRPMSTRARSHAGPRVRPRPLAGPGRARRAVSAVPLTAGALRLVQLAGGPAVMPADDRFTGFPVALVVHIAGAAVFALVGALQFVPRFRRRHRAWHRRAGRVVAVAGLRRRRVGAVADLFYAPTAGHGRPALRPPPRLRLRDGRLPGARVRRDPPPATSPPTARG